MENKRFLNEENYQKTKKKILGLAVIVLVIGLVLGGSLIAVGLNKQSKINLKYSDANKAKITAKLEKEKQNLIQSKTDLENKIKPVEDEIKKLERVSFNGFNDDYYARKDKIEELNKSIAAEKNSIDVIDDALDESFSHCSFDEAKNNTYTSSYCSLKNQLKELNSFNKSFDSSSSIPFYMFGAFVIIAGAMIAFSIFMFAKRREVLAFGAQQVVPVGKEIIEDVAPSVGKAVGTIAKDITSGIKQGMNNDEK